MPSLDAHFDTMRALVSGRVEPDALAPFMQDGGSPGERAQVYPNSSALAASDALKSNYLATAAIMGEEFFGAMARSYVEANRPVVRSLVGYGASLPDFIAEAETEHALPWLADIARLDRAWLESHIAADSETLTVGALAVLASDEAALMDARPALRPDVRICPTTYDAFDLWTALRAGVALDTEVRVRRKRTNTLLWRPEGEVLSRALAVGEAAFLYALGNRARLGDAAETGLAADPGFDVGAAFGGAAAAGLFLPLDSSRGDRP